MVEAYANGVSTRDMAPLAQSLGVASLSSPEVSGLASGLDAQAGALRTRDLGDRRYCHLWVDATYVRCRVEGRPVSQAVVTATAPGEGGRKRLVGLDCVDAEPYDDWRAFLASVRARGLSGLVLAVSDDHAGLVRAPSEAFQGVAWQRRAVHPRRNASAAGGRAADAGLVRELVKATFAQGDALVARAPYPRACDAIRAAGEGAAADPPESARDDAQQYLSLPREHWSRVRTNDAQGRANREMRRRCRPVRSFPSRASLPRLVGAVLLGEEDVWAGHRVFSPESTARARARAEPPAPDGALARAVTEADRTAETIVKAIVDQYGGRQWDLRSGVRMAPRRFGGTGRASLLHHISARGPPVGMHPVFPQLRSLPLARCMPAMPRSHRGGHTQPRHFDTNGPEGRCRLGNRGGVAASGAAAGSSLASAPPAFGCSRRLRLHGPHEQTGALQLKLPEVERQVHGWHLRDPAHIEPACSHRDQRGEDADADQRQPHGPKGAPVPAPPPAPRRAVGRPTVILPAASRHVGQAVRGQTRGRPIDDVALARELGEVDLLEVDLLATFAWSRS